MMLETYPNDDDRRALGGAHDLLAEAGVAAGPAGYDLATLAAAAYAHGWAYRIDRASGTAGYRAEIRPQQGATTQPFVAGVGWTPEVALAFALAQALVRRARLAGHPLPTTAEPEKATAAE